MLRILTALCVLAPVGAQAFSQCTVTPIGGPSAFIVEEASNPVVSGGIAYTGYTKGSSVIVIAATDNGATLGDPVTVSGSGSHRARHLRLSTVDNRVYAAWQEGDEDGKNLKMLFAASRDHALAGSWDAPTELGASATDIAQVASDASNVHVVWVMPNDDIAVVSSTDSGRRFDAPIILGKGTGEVVVASEGKHVYVAWETGNLTPTRDVMFAVSSDFGKTFPSIADISNDGKRNAREPILSLNHETGRLSLVWREDDPVQGVYLQSKDNGKTWSKPKVVADSARQVMVQDDNAYIYVTYLLVAQTGKKHQNLDYQTSLVVSTDGGKTWSEPKNLTGPSGISHLHNDDDRPIPWALNGKIRITGIEADGVHIWSGEKGHLRDGIYLGPGILASPQGNSAVWQAPGSVVNYASCR
ncbi:MAG TPA: sialidase family protein [Rhizomicrobium sp.]|nr:sialidase family protein [Rhizomicrobium sp.]